MPSTKHQHATSPTPRKVNFATFQAYRVISLVTRVVEICVDAHTANRQQMPYASQAMPSLAAVAV